MNKATFSLLGVIWEFEDGDSVQDVIRLKRDSEQLAAKQLEALYPGIIEAADRARKSLNHRCMAVDRLVVKGMQLRPYPPEGTTDPNPPEYSERFNKN